MSVARTAQTILTYFPQQRTQTMLCCFRLSHVHKSTQTCTTSRQLQAESLKCSCMYDSEKKNILIHEISICAARCTLAHVICFIHLARTSMTHFNELATERLVYIHDATHPLLFLLSICLNKSLAFLFHIAS